MINNDIINICNSLANDTITWWKEYTQGSSSKIRYGEGHNKSYILKTSHLNNTNYLQQESYIDYIKNHERYSQSAQTNHISPSYLPFLYKWTAYHLLKHIDWISLQFSQYTTNQIKELATILWKLHTTLPTQEQLSIYYQWRYHFLYGPDSLASLYTKLLTTNTDLNIWKQIIKTLTHRYTAHNHDHHTRRVVSLHGDLHYRNVLIDNTLISLIDPSSYPYGDPIIDVGSIILSMEMNHYYDDTYDFESHKNIFLDTYISITNNTNIMDLYPVVALSLLWNIIDPLIQQQLYHFWKQKFQSILSLVEQYTKKVLHL